MNNFIEVQDVVKQYSGHMALDHVSMRVPEQCIYGLLGPNGAGKTSLIRILNLITRPDAGSVLLGGNDITRANLATIGYLPEERGLYKKMKVGEQIVYLARLKNMPKELAVSEMKIWLERFDLTQWEHKRLETLSKGMQQKVQFISTVIHKPRLLIFDEPFSGFDPVNANQLKQEILRLRDEGATILFSTHNMESVEQICERITLINKAQVVLEGAVEDIKQMHKKHLYSIAVPQGETIKPAERLFTVESSATAERSQTLIRLCKGVPTHDVIDYLNQHYNLLAFNELLPSMNEIFIERVTGKFAEGPQNND